MVTTRVTMVTTFVTMVTNMVTTLLPQLLWLPCGYHEVTTAIVYPRAPEEDFEPYKDAAEC